jgi:hypothetical protein
VDGATSISTISLVDMEVESFPPYIYVPIPWVKAHQNYRRGAPSLGNLSCSKLEFSPFLSRAAARSSLHPSPKFCIYSLRSGELPTKVRRAFPATFLVSGENRHCCKVVLVVPYAVLYSFSRIRVRLIVFLIYLSFPANLHWLHQSSSSSHSWLISSGQSHLSPWDVSPQALSNAMLSTVPLCSLHV